MNQTRSLFFSLLLLGACGGGDGEGSGGSSGVSGSKTIDQVTEADAIAVCEWANSLAAQNAAAYTKLGCYSFAIAFSEGDQDACEMSAQSCIQEDNDPVEEDDCSDAGSELTDLPECASEVTVGEFEACTRAQNSAAVSAANSIDCSWTQEQLEGLDETPSACAALAEKCPDLFGDDGGQ